MKVTHNENGRNGLVNMNLGRMGYNLKGEIAVVNDPPYHGRCSSCGAHIIGRDQITILEW